MDEAYGSGRSGSDFFAGTEEDEEEFLQSESLVRAGLFLDANNKIRIIDPAAFQSLEKLSSAAQDFNKKTGQFLQLVDNFSQIIVTISQAVEMQKMKALALRKELKNVSGEREEERETLVAQIAQRKREIEALQAHLSQAKMLLSSSQ